jgi:phosphoglycerate dehydrogenase-like enzyme
MRLLLHSSSFPFNAAHRQMLEATWPGIVITTSTARDLADVDGAGIDILVSDPVPATLVRWPDLKWIQLLSAGSNQLRGSPFPRPATPVTTASGTHGVPMAQYVTCAWLMLVHQMPASLHFQSSREWPNRLVLGGYPVRSLTAAIVGYGSIGRECARQLHQLGMRIVALKRDPSVREDYGYNAWPKSGDPHGVLPDRWYGPTQVKEMLPECDLVVVTSPSTPATVGMIGAAELAAMRPTARVIVISRGGIVVESALAEALRRGVIAGAAVDCLEREPPARDHPFFETPNLLLTPHVSGVYAAFWDEMAKLLAENLRRFRLALPLFNTVDAKRGY